LLALGFAPRAGLLEGSFCMVMCRLPLSGCRRWIAGCHRTVGTGHCAALRNRDALTNLLEQIYDPASPNYHHYLTSAQFAEQFGPAEKDYEAVAAFAKAHGLTITGGILIARCSM